MLANAEGETCSGYPHRHRFNNLLVENSNFPQGWDAERVNRVIVHYEKLNEEEAVAEDEGLSPGTGKRS